MYCFDVADSIRSMGFGLGYGWIGFIHRFKIWIMNFEDLKNLAYRVKNEGDYKQILATIDSLRGDLNLIQKSAFDSLCDHQPARIGDKVELFDYNKSRGMYIITGWEIYFSKIKPKVAKIKKDGAPYGVNVYVSFTSYKKAE